jgi:hypothetical protein
MGQFRFRMPTYLVLTLFCAHPPPLSIFAGGCCNNKLYANKPQSFVYKFSFVTILRRLPSAFYDV